MDMRFVKSDVEDKFVNINDLIIHLMKLAMNVHSKEVSYILKDLVNQLTEMRDNL